MERVHNRIRYLGRKEKLNVKEVIEEYEKEYEQDIEDIRRQE